MRNSPLLTVEDLKVYFQSRRETAKAVDGIGFHVNAGETVCLVGESGCGKSVSALSVMGLLPHPAAQIMGGRVFFDGTDLLGLDDAAMRRIRGRHIAMVFQEPLTSLNPVFTIENQIREAMDIHLHLTPEESTRACIDLLNAVGIASAETRMHSYPHQLSGGQRQRVMIAMALSCRPALIIADEPTTALDVTVQAQILALLRGLQAEHGMSFLYITHDLGVVRDIADRVYVMYAGVMVEEGVAGHVLDKPRHPYTRGLVRSLPTLSGRGTRLYSIPGSVPDPAHKPPGCPFHPRCPHAVATCRTAFPSMCDYGGGHLARCPVLHEKESEKAS